MASELYKRCVGEESVLLGNACYDSVIANWTRYHRITDKDLGNMLEDYNRRPDDWLTNGHISTDPTDG